MARGFILALGCIVIAAAGAQIVGRIGPETRGDVLHPAANLVSLQRQALARDPASPYRWCDLGEALLIAGDTEHARTCFARALQLGPNIPTTLLHVAGFHFRLGETRPALKVMARVLAVAPVYDGLLFSYFDKMETSPDEILAYGLAQEPRVVQSYFRHVLQNGSLQDANSVWRWMNSRGFQGDAAASEYAGFLLQQGQYETAADMWAERSGSHRGDFRHGNLVYNGGFEFEPERCPLDWSTSEVKGVRAGRSQETAVSGKWSYKIDFLGLRNVEYQQVSQMVCARPGPMLLRAFIKTEELTTDQGVCLRVFDAESAARLDKSTEQVTGTAGWRQIELSFVAPAETHLLAVQVRRAKSLRFSSGIAGRAWIDDVTLQPSAR
jgi:hypothetical protein